MNKKQYLKQGYRINLEIESKNEVLQELKANLDGLQAIKLTERAQGGKIPSDENIVNRMSKILDMEKQITELHDFQVKLSEEINKMKNVNERLILRYRYVLNLTWAQIADKLGYTLRQVHRIHETAIKNVIVCHSQGMILYKI